MVREPHEAGLLRLPSGRLLAGDPFADAITDREAFTVGVPSGDHPVSIGWAEWASGDTMVTAVRVLIRDEQAATWEMALLNEAQALGRHEEARADFARAAGLGQDP